MKRALILVAALASPAGADTTAGVDGALFRSSYDSNGIFAVEGARLLPARDLSLKVLMGYGRAPMTMAVPGIGTADDDRILDQIAVLDLAFGMSFSDRVAIGIDVAAYRTATGDGFGVRGRYATAGVQSAPSTGLIALRPISNLDPSGAPTTGLDDSLAGPLDARAGIKVALVTKPRLAITAIGSVFLPFGEDQLLLGDRDFVFEPKLAVEVRQDRVHATRLVANVAARIRKRTVLESYDAANPLANPDADARVMLDVGGEVVLGVGGIYELTSRLALGGEVQVFVPLAGLTYGGCRRYNLERCDALTSADYTPEASRGDFVTQVTAGATLRVSTDVALSIMAGTNLFGARGDDIRATAGIIWAPQVAGTAAVGSADRDNDLVPDSQDACTDEAEDRDDHQDEDGCPDPDNDSDGLLDGDDRCPANPEDKDGFEDEDGCPERDNDSDGLADVDDRCPSQAEDTDGFEDTDGCPDDDNDADGFLDAQDRCPNDAETVNGIDDEDGCPDARGTSGPEERADRIDLKGQAIVFAKNNTLSPAAKRLLDQVAVIVKQRKLSLRIEVHVALGTKSKSAKKITAQKKKDKATTQARGRAIVEYLMTQGVDGDTINTAGMGSDRPLGKDATDPANERVELVKVRQ